MFNLSPIRLLIIVVVALVVLGPDKLPHFAKQAGAAWKTLRTLQERVEGEIRQAVPDLPRSADIARYARSPISLLNTLADKAGIEAAMTSNGTGTDSTVADSAAKGFELPDDEPEVREPERPPVAWGDPSLN